MDLLKDNVFSKITEEEQRYIETYILDILGDDKLFKRNLCLCHNDLSINHILIDEDKRISGIIDFGDACIIEDYRDFMYLLEESDEEIGQEFGLAILEKYQYDDVRLALAYAQVNDDYYPIETIVCGIENDDDKLLEKGINLLREKICIVKKENGSKINLEGKC